MNTNEEFKKWKTIIIKGNEYEVIINADDSVSLKTYDTQYKMWVKLNFAKEKDQALEDGLIKMLSKIYIEKVTGINQ